MVWMCDAGQKMIYASKMWQAFTGMDGIGEDTRSWGAFIHPDDRQRARENFETGFQKRERISTTYRLCKKRRQLPLGARYERAAVPER